MFHFLENLSETKFHVLPLSTKHLAGIDATYAGIGLRGSVGRLPPATAATFGGGPPRLSLLCTYASAVRTQMSNSLTIKTM